MLFRFWVFSDCTFLDISSLTIKVIWFLAFYGVSLGAKFIQTFFQLIVSHAFIILVFTHSHRDLYIRIGLRKNCGKSNDALEVAHFAIVVKIE